jgi:hypothetical protein
VLRNVADGLLQSDCRLEADTPAGTREVIPAGEQRLAKVRADESGPTRHEDTAMGALALHGTARPQFGAG